MEYKYPKNVMNLLIVKPHKENKEKKSRKENPKLNYVNNTVVCSQMWLLRRSNVGINNRI